MLLYALGPCRVLLVTALMCSPERDNSVQPAKTQIKYCFAYMQSVAHVLRCKKNIYRAIVSLDCLPISGTVHHSTVRHCIIQSVYLWRYSVVQTARMSTPPPQRAYILMRLFLESSLIVLIENKGSVIYKSVNTFIYTTSN